MHLVRVFGGDEVDDYFLNLPVGLAEYLDAVDRAQVDSEPVHDEVAGHFGHVVVVHVVQHVRMVCIIDSAHGCLLCLCPCPGLEVFPPVVVDMVLCVLLTRLGSTVKPKNAFSTSIAWSFNGNLPIRGLHKYPHFHPTLFGYRFPIADMCTIEIDAPGE